MASPATTPTVSRIAAIKAFFEKDTNRKVETSEMMTFWKACNEEERKEFSESAASQLGLVLNG